MHRQSSQHDQTILHQY